MGFAVTCRVPRCGSPALWRATWAVRGDAVQQLLLCATHTELLEPAFERLQASQYTRDFQLVELITRVFKDEHA